VAREEVGDEHPDRFGKCCGLIWMHQFNLMQEELDSVATRVDSTVQHLSLLPRIQVGPLFWFAIAAGEAQFWAQAPAAAPLAAYWEKWEFEVNVYGGVCSSCGPHLAAPVAQHPRPTPTSSGGRRSRRESSMGLPVDS
jgi:hypothetical protein